MGSHLHVCLYDTSSEPDGQLDRAIAELNFVRLGVRVNTPEALANALSDETINLVFFDLDSDPDAVVEVIEEVSGRYPDLALIAASAQTHPHAILAPMRAGCDQFVCKPVDSADLALAVSRAASKHLVNKTQSRCICVTGASGGAGSTSIASNLAMEIAHLTDQLCALVDMDLEYGDIALNFDCEPKFTIHDLAAAGEGLDHSVLMSAVMNLPCKVGILSRPIMVEQRQEVTAESIDRIFRLLMVHYENVVVDVPRWHDPRTAAVLSMADVIFVVCQPLVPSIRNARRHYETLIRLGIPDERIKIIMNREDRRNARITVKDVADTIRKPVFACIPNDYQFVSRSIDFGRPVASLDRNNPVRAAIRRIAREVTAGTDAASEEPVQKRGLFGRLVSRKSS